MAISEYLSNHLNRIRKELGLSITEFSEKLGIARSSLQALLNGTGNPRCDTIEQIAKVLHIDCASLISAPPPQDRPLLLEHFSDSQEADDE